MLPCDALCDTDPHEVTISMACPSRTSHPHAQAHPMLLPCQEGLSPSIEDDPPVLCRLCDTMVPISQLEVLAWCLP